MIKIVIFIFLNQKHVLPVLFRVLPIISRKYPSFANLANRFATTIKKAQLLKRFVGIKPIAIIIMLK